MREVVLRAPDDYEGWRDAARALAEANVPPGAVVWRAADDAPDLFVSPPEAPSDAGSPAGSHDGASAAWLSEAGWLRRSARGLLGRALLGVVPVGQHARLGDDHVPMPDHLGERPTDLAGRPQA